VKAGSRSRQSSPGSGRGIFYFLNEARGGSSAIARRGTRSHHALPANPSRKWQQVFAFTETIKEDRTRHRSMHVCPTRTGWYTDTLEIRPASRASIARAGGISMTSAAFPRPISSHRLLTMGPRDSLIAGRVRGDLWLELGFASIFQFGVEEADIRHHADNGSTVNSPAPDDNTPLGRRVLRPILRILVLSSAASYRIGVHGPFNEALHG